MSTGGVRIAIVAAALLVVSATPLSAWDPANPDDPAAHAAAKTALKALGPDRGARSLAAPDVRTVAGIGLGLKARAEDLDKAIRTLGARVTETEIRVDISSDLLFDFDKADIKPKAEAELERLAVVIQQRRKGDVMIYGHTDFKGDTAYNQRLSERRAEAVMAWLVEKGQIPPGVIKTKGFGKSRPIAPNVRPDGSDDPEGRAKNRRVEVIIKTVGKPP